MNAIIIGMMTFVIFTIVLVVIIITGLSLLAWFLGTVPGNLHISRSSPIHGEYPVALHEQTQKNLR